MTTNESGDAPVRRRGWLAWIATLASVFVGIVLLAAVMAVSDCSFAGGRCPDPGPSSFDGGPFAAGLLAGALITAPPLLLGRCRPRTVVAVTLVVALVLGYGAATS